MGISEAQLDDGPLETQVNTFTGSVNKLTCSQFDYSFLGLRTYMALWQILGTPIHQSIHPRFLQHRSVSTRLHLQLLALKLKPNSDAEASL